jgi:D-arabinose 1-dehydrogenase-like Zn-dependent alcohol dehydrogenase
MRRTPNPSSLPCHSYRLLSIGIATYPMVPGHEIIGDVIAIGSAVTELRVGQRVGVTPQVSCCKVCDDCVRGETQLCKKQQWNYGFPTGDATQPITYGGFASHTRVNEHWAFPIPDALPTIAAAPLLCAGILLFVHPTIVIINILSLTVIPLIYICV